MTRSALPIILFLAIAAALAVFIAKHLGRAPSLAITMTIVVIAFSWLVASFKTEGYDSRHHSQLNGTEKARSAPVYILAMSKSAEGLHVIAKQDWAWTLYEEQGRLFLSAVCGGIGIYELAFEFLPDELSDYRVQGIPYIGLLSSQVAYCSDRVQARTIPGFHQQHEVKKADRAWRRANKIALDMNAPRADFLFDLALEFKNAPGANAPLRRNIQKQALLFSSPEEWAAAQKYAGKLLDHAYSLCDRARQGKHAVESVLGMLRIDCSGFSESSYRSAFNEAMVATR